MEKIQYIDSHTGGEPTRTVIGGFPALTGQTMAARVEELKALDHYRTATVREPRGSDVMVGALITPAITKSAVCGVIFFNNVGYLGMCGHGTIGMVATLKYLDRIADGEHQIDTPVGTVTASLNADGRVTVRNVSAYRFRAAVSVNVPHYGSVVGDIAWGGNWFFLVKAYSGAIDLASVGELTTFTLAIKKALAEAHVTGADGAEIDHVEVFGAPANTQHDSRNFVLCPGAAYDRSPCGTGTSAKLACLAADGLLRPGQLWQQESVIGSVFQARYAPDPSRSDAVLPEITGIAHISGEGTLLLDPADPFCWGIN